MTDLQLLRRLVTHVGQCELSDRVGRCALSDFEFERLVAVLGEVKRGAHLSPGQRELYERIATRIGAEEEWG